MKETWEKKVEKAVMVPIIISDGTVHSESVRRWKDFAPDIKVDWVRMEQNVLRYNVVIVGKFFNKGSWVSETLKKEHTEEIEVEHDEPPERMPNAEERREQLHLDTELVGVVCVRGLRARHLHTVLG